MWEQEASDWPTQLLAQPLCPPQLPSAELLLAPDLSPEKHLPLPPEGPA